MEKVVKTRYTCEEVTQFIFEPNLDSEISSFNGDDSDDNQHINIKIEQRRHDDDDSVETDDENKNKTKEYPKERVFITIRRGRWNSATQLLFSLDNIINLFVKPTNLYSVQQTGSSINPNKSELEQFFGTQMFMSIVSLLVYYMCWTVDTKYLHIVHQPYYVHQSLQKIVSIYSLQWQLRKKQ